MTEPLLPGASLAPNCAQRWQVLQQRPDGTADLVLAGRYRSNVDRFRVEARLVSERDGRPVRTNLDWRSATLHGDDGWELTLDGLPAGGLYRLETRVWRGEGADLRPMRGDYAHHLGVGDIWVIAGQSNASGTGLGYVEDPPTLGVHLFGNDETWQLACHPIEDATLSRHPITVHGVFQAHSAWLTFGRRLLDELGHPIGLIPTALGGSPLSMWEPAKQGLLYHNLLDMVGRAGGRVRGVIWYQGESDAQPALVATYAERFTAFIDQLRRDLDSPELPVLCAQLGRVVAPGDAQRAACWTQLREIQRRLAGTIDQLWLVPAVDLPLSDEIHLSAASNVQLGHRFADQALRTVYGQERPAPALRLVSATMVGQQTVRLEFSRSPVGWCRPGDIRSLTAEDAAGELAVAAVAVDDEGWVDLRLERAPQVNLTVHCHAGCHPPADLRDRDQRPVEAFSVAVPFAG